MRASTRTADSREPTAGPETRPVGGAVTVVAGDPLRRRRIVAALAEAGVAVRAAAAETEALASPDGALVLGFDRLDEHALATVEAVRARLEEGPLVVVASELAASTARRALDGGVDAVVAESRLRETLAPALAAARAGLLVLPAALRAGAGLPALSPREKQALAMVVMGCSNADIARKLHVAETTVKSHLSSSFRKLGVRTRAQATALILDPQRGLGLGILRLSGD